MTTTGASTPAQTQSNGNVILLGRLCGNTRAVEIALRKAGIDLAAVILADRSSMPEQRSAAQPRSMRYRSPSPRATRRLLEDLQPDLVIAACYPWRLSHRARAMARHGVLNIHPSPLPHGRGPDPVFWAYRNGDRETGVTIHLMDDGLDSGPILAQQRLPVSEGMDAVTLEQHLFEIGAKMVAELLLHVLVGNAVSTPQDDQAATYQPAPSAHDWIISPLLPAAWAWNFAQGVQPLHGPLMVQTGGQLIPVQRAISWSDHGAPPDNLPPGVFAIQFRPGWVIFEA